MRKPLALMLGLSLLTLMGCNDVPVRTLYEDFGLLTKLVPSSRTRTKIDFLWVIDNSGSMCQEQNSLARDFNKFIDELKRYSNIDYRIAVSTTYVNGNSAHKGRFQNKPADSFQPGCQVNVTYECYSDAQCAFLKPEFGPGWSCSWEDKAANLALNDNGTVNSMCHKGCDSDGECTEYFGDSYICSMPPGQHGCLEPPQVQECPSDLPTVLDNSNFNYFFCNATVGADMDPGVNLEAGIKAGWLALKHPKADDICSSTSPNSCDLYSGIKIESTLKWIPDELSKVERAISATGDEAYRQQLQEYQNYLNACQARFEGCDHFINPAEPNFLRDDAYLVIVFVTDEDDCSDRDDNPFTLNDIAMCGSMPEKLAPIKEYVNHYRSLKTDPAKVILVGIVGDATISGRDSCLVPDECVFVRGIDQCECYDDALPDRSGCPALLQDDTQATMCTASCLEEPDPELRKTTWCQDSPPMDWCHELAEAAPTDNCFWLKGMISAYEDKIEQTERILANSAAAAIRDARCCTGDDASSCDTQCMIDEGYLESSAAACVNKLFTFESELTAVQGALAGCQADLTEELKYRAGCLDHCLGADAEYSNRKCSADVAGDDCGCYDSDSFDDAACQEAFEDEFSYRVSCQRACFKEAKELARYKPGTAPYVCSSIYGRADWGSRYIDLVSRFGRNGIVSNLCSAGGIGSSLRQIAESILPIIFRVCIPKPPVDASELLVVRESDGARVTLLQGPDADFEVVPDSQCADTKQAIVFHPVPAPTDRIEVYFQAATD